MKRVLTAGLIASNIGLLGGLWYYKHNYETMLAISNLRDQFNQEFLLITSMIGKDGYKRLFATPTIFRSLEKCTETERDWNANNRTPGALWYCENYRNSTL